MMSGIPITIDTVKVAPTLLILGATIVAFVRMGVVLDLIVAVVALVLIPRYWPLFTS